MVNLLAGSPSVLRQLNSVAVLAAVRDHGPITRPSVARQTGLSLPTVNEVVQSLVDAGVVEAVGTADGPVPGVPGRRAAAFAFRARSGYVLGIDIGADGIRCLVADLAGTVVGSVRRSTPRGASRSAASIVSAAQNAGVQAMTDARIPRSALRAVAVGTPGVVDPSSGRVTLAPQLPGWEGIELKQKMTSAYRCPVLVENEVRLSVLAERWRGVAQGLDHVLYVQLGVGIGAAVLINGELYPGVAGAAGEIGSLPVDQGDTPPEEGFGAFEWAAGGAAFARLGRQAAGTRGGRLIRELAGGDMDAIDAEVVCTAAARGDRAAQRIVARLAHRLARGIAAAVCVLNPAAVVVGGGLSRAGSTLLAPFEAELHALVPSPPRVLTSQLGDESAALGAVRNAMLYAGENLLGPKVVRR